MSDQTGSREYSSGADAFALDADQAAGKITYRAVSNMSLISEPRGASLVPLFLTGAAFA